MIAATVLLCTAGSVEAQWRRFTDDIFINLPVSWKVLEITEEKVTCANDAEEAFYLLKRYDGAAYDSGEEMDRGLRRELGASGDGSGELFRFQGREAAYGSISFSQEKHHYEGFLLVIEGKREDLAAVAFAETGFLDSYRAMLLSVLDALSLGEAGLVNPGPVSTFEAPRPASNRELRSLQFHGSSLSVPVSPREMEASQQLIEREAEVLNVYGGTQWANQAWKRYYRLIYRDLYARLGSVYTALRQHLPRREFDDREMAERLLEWVQEFDYYRTDTLSDLLSPLTGAVENTGDCDSRGLLYVIMLHRFDVDALLLVSSRYKHSVAAVDVTGEGARFPYGEKEYLIAETTQDVDLGMIERSMSAIEGWLGIDFRRPGGP